MKLLTIYQNLPGPLKTILKRLTFTGLYLLFAFFLMKNVSPFFIFSLPIAFYILFPGLASYFASQNENDYEENNDDEISTNIYTCSNTYTNNGNVYSSDGTFLYSQK